MIGVGNAYRGDDAVGLAVAERLRSRLPDDVTVLDCEQEPTRLLDAWQDADVALVIDAAASDAPPGTVHRVTALEDTTIIEVSTPQLDDVVRLEDEYGRSDQ